MIRMKQSHRHPIKKHTLSRLLAIALAVTLTAIAPCWSRQTATPISQAAAAQARLAEEEVAPMREIAEAALEDFYANFWTGDAKTGHFSENDPTMVWEAGMAVLMLRTMYEATGESEYVDRVNAQWEYWQRFLDDDTITRPGDKPNIACDDAAWTAMVLMSIYKMTGDQHALELAGETVRRSYEYWKDGDVANGLWYRYEGALDSNKTPINNSKSVYAVGLVLTALDYYEETEGTDLADAALYEDTLALYGWMEKNLRRDEVKQFPGGKVKTVDGLYWTDFIEGHGPSGLERPLDIREAGSVSSLFGNMGMAAVNARLYTLTGEETYRAKAVQTANSLAGSTYNKNGVFLNDRDAWTNATFVRQYVLEVLPLEGVDPVNYQLFEGTARSIQENCRTEDGYYRAEWSGGTRWDNGQTTEKQIMTNATTLGMLAAAALAEANPAPPIAQPTQGPTAAATTVPSAATATPTPPTGGTAPAAAVAFATASVFALLFAARKHRR